MRDEAELWVLLLLAVGLKVRAAHPLMELILEFELRPALARVQQMRHALDILQLSVGVRLFDAKELAVVGPESI